MSVQISLRRESPLVICLEVGRLGHEAVLSSVIWGASTLTLFGLYQFVSNELPFASLSGHRNLLDLLAASTQTTCGFMAWTLKRIPELASTMKRSWIFYSRNANKGISMRVRSGWTGAFQVEVGMGFSREMQLTVFTLVPYIWWLSVTSQKIATKPSSFFLCFGKQYYGIVPEVPGWNYHLIV